MTEPLTCLVVDDEPIAIEIIEKFISRIPDLELVGTCNDAIAAITKIKEQKPQILFLDINMPEISGFELLDILKNSKPQVILTTAYEEFALRGYEYDVVDYLMKPIPFDKFVTATEKVKERIKLLNNNINDSKIGENLNDSFYLKTDKKNYYIKTTDIKYVSAMEDYLKIYLHNHQKEFLVVRLTMNSLEEQLPKNKLLRIHRSYIVNMEEIKYLDGNQIMIKSGIFLPIGKTFQDNVRKIIKEMTLGNI